MESFEQLRETYGAMTDDELMDVTHDAYDLTKLAQEALKAEIARRGLKIDWKSASPAVENTPQDLGDDEDQELVVEAVTSVRSADEARILQHALNKYGIRSYLGPDNAESVSSFYGSFDQPVQLNVFVSFLGQAGEVVARVRKSLGWEEPVEPDEDETTEEAGVSVVRCPKCHSDEVIFDQRAIAVGQEVQPDSKFDWHCDACGYKWEDDGIEP